MTEANISIDQVFSLGCLFIAILRIIASKIVDAQS